MTENTIDTSNTVRIEIKDWLYNAGILGFYRILKNAEKECLVKDNYIECDSSCFDGFEEDFFKYFIDEYGKDGLWPKLIEFCKAKISLENPQATDEGRIKEFLAEFDKDLDKASYRSAYAIISKDENHIKNLLKDIKDKSVENSKKLERIKEIYSYFQENKNIIQAKYVIYTAINYYLSNISFLNKQQVKNNMYELLKRDFVEPAVHFFKSEAKKSFYGNCMICNRVINKKGEGFEGLSWLKMDLDSARKTSVYWNHTPDIIICPICNLVLSCVPAGYVTYKQKGIFINDNSNMDRLIGINEALTLSMKESDTANMESLEEKTYVHIINMIRQMQEERKTRQEIDNIQVVKYDNVTKSYTFNLLSKQVLKVIESSKKELEILSKLYDVFLDRKNKINLYDEVIEHIYGNRDLYPLVGLILGLAIRKKARHGLADLIFKINMKFIGGDMSDKKIQVMKMMGLKLKKGYREEQNKIPGIAYRLLNNLKTKNINGFMDVAINCHMHIGLEVPTLFIECIDDAERFQAFGYAFLIGFMGEEYIPDSKGENQKEAKP